MCFVFMSMLVKIAMKYCVMTKQTSGNNPYIANKIGSTLTYDRIGPVKL